MATVDITREHSLGKESAREKAQLLADKLAQKLDATCTWEGDDLKFKRSGADGQIAVSADQVSVQLKLGLLLSALGGTIQREIEEVLDRELC